MRKKTFIFHVFYIVFIMVIISGCSRKPLEQDVEEVEVGNQVTVEAQTIDEKTNSEVQQKFTLERVSAENFYYDEAQKEEPVEINEIPAADILCSADWGDGNFSICRVNKKVENNSDFYDIIAVYEEHGVFIRLAHLEEENGYSDIRMMKYENTLKFDGYKVMIPVGANAQDVFYFTYDKSLHYPEVIFKVSALDTCEFDLDLDGINEIIAMQLGTSIYDEDSNGYFFYSTEEYMQKNRLDFDSDKGYYFIKNQNGQVMNTYSLIRNSELIVDSGQADNDKDSMLKKYKSVLEDVYYNHTFPDGEACDWDDNTDLSQNMYSIYDIDKDNKEELVLVYSTASMAGMVELIYGYNYDTKTMNEELRIFPNATHYDNGIIKEDWSHNQGMAGDFWPYSLYQYDQQSDQYISVGMVDAWDRTVSETNYDNEEFPSDCDTDEDGIVYYIMRDDNYELKDPIDGSEYQKWIDSYIGSAKELKIPFSNMTKENLAKIDDGIND